MELAEPFLFIASALAAELSMKILVATNTTGFSGQGVLHAISQNSLRIQLKCFAQSYRAMYSDSAEDVATSVCFLVLQTIGVLLMAIIGDPRDGGQSMFI